MGCLGVGWWDKPGLDNFLAAGEDGWEIVALSSESSLLLHEGGVGGRWNAPELDA